MKTIKNLPVPQDTNTAKWPYGQIKNQTETEEGTPVVREIYGDLLVNIYKILEDAGITPNGQEDSEDTGYQILAAFKKFANELNDIEHVISLNGTTWNIPVNIDKLPNKYVMFCRMADAYNSGLNYTFAGTGNKSYSLTSPTGFSASDEVMVIIDQAEVRVYSMTSAVAATSGGVFPVFGNPVAFNDTDAIYYESDGRLLTDAPSSVNLQQNIRVAASNSTLYVNEILILKGFAFCVVFDTAVQTYRFFQCPLGDLENPVEVTVNGIPTGVDNSPYVYTDGQHIYISNASGKNINNYEIDKYSYANAVLTFVQTISLNTEFVKSTNVVIKGGFLISFVEGILKKYDLGTGESTTIGDFNTLLGVIFNFKNEVYYSNGEVAKKWTV